MATQVLVHEQQAQLPEYDAILCLGRGNSINDGVSAETLSNGITAARLSLTHLSPGGIVIPTGLGPEKFPYAQSEAAAMAEVIGLTNPGALVFPEIRATNTFDNILNSSELIPDSARHIGIIGTRGHSERAAMIARAWFGGDYNITPLNSEAPVSISGMALEKTLGILTTRALRGVSPRDRESLEAARDEYNRKISRLKNSRLRRAHSGRK